MMDYPEEFIQFLQSIKSKRAKIVIDHILEHGFITTETLETDYGYSHPPRAARDVREQGVPLVTLRVKASDGRTIAAYKLGDISKIHFGKTLGRRTYTKAFKRELFEQQNGKCAICAGYFEERYLQIDHRVPYEIGGDDFINDFVNTYMLLCATCNRAKSWSCEHCPNWHQHLVDICLNCYWASPIEYEHIATFQERRTDIRWEQSELPLYDALNKEARTLNVSLPEHIKHLLAKLKRNRR
jgi:hypothetical protein